jgi:hypothetical protein
VFVTGSLLSTTLEYALPDVGVAGVALLACLAAMHGFAAPQPVDGWVENSASQPGLSVMTDALKVRKRPTPNTFNTILSKALHHREVGGEE